MLVKLNALKLYLTLLGAMLLSACGGFGLQLNGEKPFASNQVLENDGSGAIRFDGTQSTSFDPDNPGLEYQWTFRLLDSTASCSPAVGYHPEGALPGAPVLVDCSDGSQLQVNGNAESISVFYNSSSVSSRAVEACLKVRNMQGVLGDAPEARGACQTVTNVSSEDIVALELVGPTSIGLGVLNTVSGSCSPDAVGSINISLNGATPSSVGPCDCVSGAISCPDITITQISNTVLIQADYDSQSDSINSASISSVSSISPASIGEGITTFTGTCAPNANGSISLSLQDVTPTTGGPCNCVNGAYSCDVDIANIFASPSITINNSAGSNGAPSSTTIFPSVAASIDLDNPGFLDIDTPTTLTGSCSPDGVDNIDVAVSDAFPVNFTCDCVSSQISCPAVTFTELPVSPSIMVNLGPVVDVETASTNAFIDITDPATLVLGNNTFAGSCAPNATGNILLNIPGAIPNSASCDCANSAFSCDVNFSSLPSSPTVTASENAGSNGPATDSIVPTVSQTIDLINPGNLSVGSPVTLMGTCSPNGASSISMAIAGASPSSQTCGCSGGAISCSPITFTSLPASPSIVASLGAANDTEMVSTNSAMNITGPATLSVGQNTFTGTCAPEGVDTVSLSIPGASPSSANCDCVNSAFSCDVSFSSLPANPVVTASENSGANGPVTDNISPTVIDGIDLNNPGNLSVGTPVTLTGICSPNGSGNVSISIPGASPNSQSCDCNNGAISCSDLTFASLPANPSIVAGLGAASDTEMVATNSDIDIIDPATLLLGNNTFAGTCAPEGTGSIDLSIPGATPNSASCDCVSSAFSCDVNFSSLPANPTVTASENTGANGPATDSILPAVVDAIDLNNPGNLTVATPVTFTGICSPDGSNAVSLTIAGASPSSQTCDCSNGTLACSATTFTSLPNNPSIVANLGTASDTENVISNSFIDISGPATVSLGSNTFVGTCGPNDTGNIALSIPGAIPNSTTCNCANGAFSCNINFSSLPSSPTVTVSENTGANGPATDTLSPTVVGTIDLTNPGNLSVGSPVTFAGTCSPNGSGNISMAIAGASPNNQSCDCSGGAISCAPISFSTLPLNPSIVATLGMATDTETVMTNSAIDIIGPASINIGANTFVGSCSPEGTGTVSLSIPGATPSAASCNCTGSTFSCNVNFTSLPTNPVITASENSGANGPATDTLSPTVDDGLDLTNPGNISLGTPVTFAGTCSPNGTNNVDLAFADASPSGQTCSCTNSAIVCSPISFTSLPIDLETVASLGTATDTENSLSNSAIDIVGPASIDLGNNTFSGSCAPNDTGNILISLPGAIPSSANCDCSNGAFSCDVNFSSVPGSPVVTASENSGANGPATDTLSPTVADSIDLTNPGTLTVGSPVTLTGSCSPGGTDNISMAIAGASPSSQTCSCVNSAISCSALTFTSLPETTSIVASLGTANDTENTDVTSAITLNTVGDIDYGSNVFTGTCAPDAVNSIIVSSTNTVPSESSPCSCSGGTFSCSIDYTSIDPGTVEISAKNGVGVGATTADIENITVINSHVDADDFTYLYREEPTMLTGTCAPNGTGNISFAIPGATPSSLTCDCVLGAIDCSLLSFTNLPIDPPIITATESIGQNGPDTDTIENLLYPIEFVGTATTGSDTNSNSFTSFGFPVVSGSNRIAIVNIHKDDSTTNSVSSVSYGGQAMTQASAVVQGQSSGYRTRNEIWILTESQIQNMTGNTVFITWTGGTSNIGYSARYLINVDQANPILLAGSNSSQNTNTISINATEADLSATYVAASHGSPLTSFTLAPIEEQSPDPFYTDSQGSFIAGTRLNETATTTNYVSTADDTQRMVIHYVNFKNAD